MGTTRLSTQTKDLSTSDGTAINTHVQRRTAILSGSALALTALMARSEAVFAQQTDQTKGNEPAARPNPIVRRVVTGTNSQGHSYALMDGNLTQGLPRKPRPVYAMTQLSTRLVNAATPNVTTNADV